MTLLYEFNVSMRILRAGVIVVRIGGESEYKYMPLFCWIRVSNQL